MAEIDPPSVTGAQLPVTFFIANEPDIEGLRSLDPDQDLEFTRRGEHSWVVQTYLRLRAAGYPVALANDVPQRGLVIFHAKHKHSLARAAGASNGLIFVGIRADNSAPLLADYEIVQNGWFSDGVRRFPITFWPQPGIVPRDAVRGTRLERIGYMGMIENLAPEFQSQAWVGKLAEIGLEWVPRTFRFRAMGDPARVDWEDYRKIDVMLAVRPREEVLRFAKPASKLINAWRVGVPALVGPEFQYQELQRSEEDFIEVRDVSMALEALKRLKGDPDLYRRMVVNGHRRAAEFTYPEITRRWADLLFHTIPSQVAAQGLHWTHRLPLGLRLPVRRILRIVRRERSR
jgi:hypothetical protein